MSIPKHIYQTWKHKQISDELRAIVDSWKTFNPSYEYTLMDDGECASFIREHFDESVYNAYSRIIPGALKADFWRYCVLYVYGGVYADLDTLCMNSLDPFIDNYEFVTVVDLNTNMREGCHNLFNAFIASVPKHPILLGCIQRIVRQVLTNTVPPSMLDRTGPGVLGRETNLYLSRGETDSFVGKEGVHNKLHLLHFTRGDEYVGIKHGIRLFQNKNGNGELQRIYGKECQNAQICDWIHNKSWS
jgi:hypothetical protein